jgi:hypothetical protein
MPVAGRRSSSKSLAERCRHLSADVASDAEAWGAATGFTQFPHGY